MSGNGEGPPTPLMMPRRRLMIPPAHRLPALSTYLPALGIPRRGIPDAVVWPDTGVLLGLGIEADLLSRFRRHYQGRMRITKIVARELRRHSERPTAGLSRVDYDRVTAAARAYQFLLVGPGRIEPVGAGQADLPEIEAVSQQLKALPGSADKSHGGEAEIIVLARGQVHSQQRKHVLLTNDGGASVIADQHGVPARHFGDILAELACAQRELKPADCLHAFTAALWISAPPAHCRPSGMDYFTCVMNETGCSLCDTAS